ncbi:hypothetical protein DERP_010712 [Dermatophagoides pteronyssinus]|uniref:Uncharacterized protein n=1 Tax=Dermatophagoides pteronyssinus TaxID=6956 RepID=A0ABQ8J6E7_DERPT|nr:hypothetical protein DERP_010712 [Dermatophagoides pteronyssinus]
MGYIHSKQFAKKPSSPTSTSSSKPKPKPKQQTSSLSSRTISELDPTTNYYDGMDNDYDCASTRPLLSINDLQQATADALAREKIQPSLTVEYKL